MKATFFLRTPDKRTFLVMEFSGDQASRSDLSKLRKNLNSAGIDCTVDYRGVGVEDPPSESLKTQMTELVRGVFPGIEVVDETGDRPIRR